MWDADSCLLRKAPGRLGVRRRWAVFCLLVCLLALISFAQARTELKLSLRKRNRIRSTKKPGVNAARRLPEICHLHLDHVRFVLKLCFELATNQRAKNISFFGAWLPRADSLHL